MVTVRLRYKANLGILVKALASQMPKIVTAAFLNEFQMKLNDVSVQCTEWGEFDVNVQDLEIIIEAHGPESLRLKFELIATEIVKSFHEFLSGKGRKNIRGFLRMQLQERVSIPL
jgi:hypothetical protein